MVNIPPGRTLRRFTERSALLSAAARGTRAFHDSIFSVDPWFENDPGVRAAALTGDTAGVLIGGIGAGAGVAKAVRRAGRSRDDFIRSLDEIRRDEEDTARVLERRRDRAAFPGLEDIRLPPVSRAEALNEYRTLNMPEAATETWLDIRTNRRGFLDDHEDGPHRGHTISRHIAISDQAVNDRVLLGGRDEASMFLNHEITEAAISRVFDVKREKIAKWFNRRKVGSEKPFDVESPLGQGRKIGMVARKGGASFVDGHTVVVRLKKVSDTEFRIVTVFVEWGMDFMRIRDRYPGAWEFLMHYRWYWDDLDIDDENEIARRTVESQDREDFDAYLSEIREIIAMKPFPWREIVRWSNRSQPDEQATREWLENFIRLIEKHLAATAG